MNNEAVIETNGDSQMSPSVEETSAPVAEEQAEQNMECSNGVCMLTWKPTRSAA